MRSVELGFVLPYAYVTWRNTTITDQSKNWGLFTSYIHTKRFRKRWEWALGSRLEYVQRGVSTHFYETLCNSEKIKYESDEFELTNQLKVAVPFRIGTVIANDRLTISAGLEIEVAVINKYDLNHKTTRYYREQAACGTVWKYDPPFASGFNFSGSDDDRFSLAPSLRMEYKIVQHYWYVFFEVSHALPEKRSGYYINGRIGARYVVDMW